MRHKNCETCVVCFKNVTIFSVGECDHAVCYECSTRMRVLCRQNECPICRQDMPKVMFIKKVRPFKDLTNHTYPMDKKFKICFESSDIQASYDKLLEHVCTICRNRPAFRTFQNLKDHMRKEHELQYCDLCVANLNIFTAERRCYTRPELALHRRKGDPDDRSHKGHPMCEFCQQRYMDNDELFRHLRRDHLFCHFCDADGYHRFYSTAATLHHDSLKTFLLCQQCPCTSEPFTVNFRTTIHFREGMLNSSNLFGHLCDQIYRAHNRIFKRKRKRKAEEELLKRSRSATVEVTFGHFLYILVTISDVIAFRNTTSEEILVQLHVPRVGGPYLRDRAATSPSVVNRDCFPSWEAAEVLRFCGFAGTSSSDNFRVLGEPSSIHEENKLYYWDSVYFISGRWGWEGLKFTSFMREHLENLVHTKLTIKAPYNKLFIVKLNTKIINYRLNKLITPVRSSPDTICILQTRAFTVYIVCMLVKPFFQILVYLYEMQYIFYFQFCSTQTI
ncbi:hypothetical protein PR048_015604 [Dryococelus australis]|uniref:RING-type E3 ubiquitin transferase n=1 Tax=Dryococelus australis TaxID=614101 RepID=A0ABQ9HHQ2_9NEOP|nr:hypothetical protein PR048_015604 [Dryococelus australis]